MDQQRTDRKKNRGDINHWPIAQSKLDLDEKLLLYTLFEI